MQYYKAKNEVRMIHPVTREIIDAAILKNELLTEKEILKKFNLKPEHKNRTFSELWPKIEKIFTPMNIKRTDTHTFFGARFTNTPDNI